MISAIHITVQHEGLGRRAQVGALQKGPCEPQELCRSVIVTPSKLLGGAIRYFWVCVCVSTVLPNSVTMEILRCRNGKICQDGTSSPGLAHS